MRMSPWIREYRLLVPEVRWKLFVRAIAVNTITDRKLPIPWCYGVVSAPVIKSQVITSNPKTNR